MKNMKIAICDDCLNDVSVINDILTTTVFNETNTIDRYTSSKKLLQSVKNNVKYDIVFLDVEMPELNGLELGKSINNLCPNTYIVFVTSYPQYAIDAFDCEAYHYLLKPIEKEKAEKVICRLAKKYRELNKYYAIKIKNESIRLPISDIYYIECCRKHIIFHLSQKKYETVGKLSTVYDKLKEFGFYQVHQGYIVNMGKISHFDKYSIVLSDGKSVVMSVRKRTDVLLAYTKYIEAER